MSTNSNVSSEKLAVAICMQAHMPVFLWGEPGTAKTKSLLALAKALDQELWTVILSIRGPWDQGGLPVIRPDGSVFMAPPAWAKELAEKGSGVVFLDELNVAPPNTQNSALRVVNEFQAGDQKLPLTTAFTCAGNPPATNAGAYDLTAAMANRLVHIDWPMDPQGWIEGMINGWRAPEVPRLPASWRNLVRSKQGVVASFIRHRPQLLHVKLTDPGEAGRAWPSHRTWDHAAIVTGAAESVGYVLKSDVARILVDGCVGEAAGREFRTWLVNLDLRDPEEYLTSRGRDVPLPERQDQIMATLDSVAAAALNASYPVKDRFLRYRAAWRLIGRVARDRMKDLALPSAMTLAKALQDETLKGIDQEGLPEELLDLEEIVLQAGIDCSKVA